MKRGDMMHLDPALLRLYRYFLAHKGKLFLAGLFMIGAAAMSSVTAMLLGKLTELGFYEKESWVIIAAPVSLIVVTLIFGVCTVASAYLMTSVSQSVLVLLRNTLYQRMLRWPAQAYQETGTGKASSKFINEAAFALSDAADSVIVMVRDSVQVVALLGVLFWHSWQLTLATLVVGPALVVVLHAIAKRMRTIVKNSQAALAEMITRVQESYEAERVVKISQTYRQEDRRFAAVNERMAGLALKTVKMQSLTTPLTQILTMTAVAVVVAVALLQARQGLLTMGEFVTFLSAMLLIKPPIQHLAGLNATFSRISVAASSVFAMMDIPLEEDAGKRQITRAQGRLTFQDVHFSYPGQERAALRGVTLTIEPGEHVAIVGESGSGKTTLVNLIPRFLSVTKGRIELDGIDTRELTLESLRKQIAIVSQQPDLIEGTLQDNVRYGIKDARMERIDLAVQAAGLTELVSTLPKGLNTPVGEAGKLLSGGQRQRIAIARALLKDAPILIMDEATSALDSKTEELIKNSLEELSRNRTCITVAHRFASITQCDRIVVMRDGQIVESGTWDELIQAKGPFATLYSMQKISAT